MHTFMKGLGSILSIFPSEGYERFVPKELATAQAMKELDVIVHSNMDKMLKEHPILQSAKIGDYETYFSRPKSKSIDVIGFE